MREMQLLLLFLPAAVLAHWAGMSGIIVFAASALAIIPLARLLGEATEAMAEKTGLRIGGLLNATFGNAAELIITLSAIRAGQIQLVLASLTGSILGNLLLVLGFAMLMGGLKNGPACPFLEPGLGGRCHGPVHGRHRPDESLLEMPLPPGIYHCHIL